MNVIISMRRVFNMINFKDIGIFWQYTSNFMELNAV